MIADYIETGNVSERGIPTGTIEQINALAGYMANNTDDVVERFDEIAPDIRRKNLLISVSEFMEPQQYIHFLDKLLDGLQVGQKGVDARVVEQAFSAGNKKMGLLAFNFQNQEVVNLCQKAKNTLPQTSSAQQVLTDILSGEQRTQIGAALFMENLPEPEMLPTEE